MFSEASKRQYNSKKDQKDQKGLTVAHAIGIVRYALVIRLRRQFQLGGEGGLPVVTVQPVKENVKPPIHVLIDDITILMSVTILFLTTYG